MGQTRMTEDVPPVLKDEYHQLIKEMKQSNDLDKLHLNILVEFRQDFVNTVSNIVNLALLLYPFVTLKEEEQIDSTTMPNLTILRQNIDIESGRKDEISRAIRTLSIDRPRHLTMALMCICIHKKNNVSEMIA